MESNSRAPALEMNGKEKEMVHQKKWAFNLFLKFWRVSDDRIVAGSLFHDAGPATANARSPKLVFERGIWRSPCAAERSRERAESSEFDRQSSLRYSGAVPQTALRTRRQSLLHPTRSGTRSQWSVCCSTDQIRVSADQNGRQVALLHSSPAGADSKHAVNC